MQPAFTSPCGLLIMYSKCMIIFLHQQFSDSLTPVTTYKMQRTLASVGRLVMNVSEILPLNYQSRKTGGCAIANEPVFGLLSTDVYRLQSETLMIIHKANGILSGKEGSREQKTTQPFISPCIKLYIYINLKAVSPLNTFKWSMN